jgi:hypothetical protein
MISGQGVLELLQGHPQVRAPKPDPDMAVVEPEADDGSRSTPVSSTRRAAKASAEPPAGPPAASRGKPVEPPPGRTQVKASTRRAKKSSSSARFAPTMARLLAITRSRARRPISASTSEGADEQIVV